MGDISDLLIMGISGKKIVSRTEGQTDVTFPCQPNQVSAATPFWKMNDILYYFSDVPSPYTSENGRAIDIGIVDLSLNGTAIECFIPTSPEYGIILGTSFVLKVAENGKYNIL